MTPLHTKLLPIPNDDTRPFWEGCRNHRLTFQKCSSCGHVRWPVSIICPVCLSSETEWTPSAGKGKVYSFVVFHSAFHPAFQAAIPYVTAIIELAEGPHFLSNIVGCSPSDVFCDMPVEVVWDDASDEISLPRFRSCLGD